MFVGAGSGWGNPFAPGVRFLLGLPGKETVPIPTSRHVLDAHVVQSWDEVPNLYRAWAVHTFGPNIQRSLAGRNLACYCPAHSTTCHASVLLELSNGGH